MYIYIYYIIYTYLSRYLQYLESRFVFFEDNLGTEFWVTISQSWHRVSWERQQTLHQQSLSLTGCDEYMTREDCSASNCSAVAFVVQASKPSFASRSTHFWRMVRSPSSQFSLICITLLVRLFSKRIFGNPPPHKTSPNSLFRFSSRCLLPCHPHPLNRATWASWLAGLSVRCSVACGWRGKHLCLFALGLLVLPWPCHGNGTNKGPWWDVNKVKALKALSFAVSFLKWKPEKRACWRQQMDAPKSTTRRVLN